MNWLRTSPYATLGLAIVCEVAATLSLKGALTSPWLIAVVAAGYGASFVLLALTLRRGMAVGVAYGLWGATGVVLTAALSVVFFQEAITPVMALGMGLIIVGVGLVELGSHAPGSSGSSGSDESAGGSAGSAGSAGPDASAQHGEA